MKVSRDGVPEIRLSVADCDSMEAIALEANDQLGYLLIGLMGRRGWRISTLTGYEKDVKYARVVNVERPDGSIVKKREVVKKHYSLPGIRRDDVGEDRVAVHAKGGVVKWEFVPEPYMTALKEKALRTHFGERVFPISEDQANDILVNYARAAKLPHPERIHAHRLRHHFGTHKARELKGDSWKLTSLMDQKDPRATKVYVEDLTPEEEKSLLERKPQTVLSDA